MSRTTLGKRSRVDEEEEVDVVQTTPSKRPRRQCKRIITTYNDDENNAPEDIITPLEEDDEIQPLPRRRIAQPSPVKKNPVTPSTPRHRDVLGGYPTTPRHAVMSAGKLFKRLTPNTPLSPGATQTIYHSARQLFARGAEPGQLIGRDSEREQLTQFLDRCTSKSPSGCLYVSGPPGTGKSAMINSMVEKYAKQDNVKTAYINCMSIKSSKDLYITLLGEINQNKESYTEAEAVAALETMFLPKDDSEDVYVAMLDEIDHILTLGLESLYRVFEWSLQSKSRLLLVGIANALDLTDRFLPRLKSKNLKPELLPFLPYNAAQIKNIITTRLKTLMPADKQTYVPFIHPAAIELCSRKVASQTGDLRRAFEICRRALDLIESETRSKYEEEARETHLQLTPTKRPLGENPNGASAGGKTVVQILSASLKSMTAENAPRASISHLNKVTAAAFNNGTVQRLKALNLQQKAALCSLVAYENRTRQANKMVGGPMTPSKFQSLAPTIKALYDAYCRLCVQDSLLHPLSSSEFREVIGSLETLGLIGDVDGKNGSFATPSTPSKRRKVSLASSDDKRVSSSVSAKDMDGVADGIGSGILRSILSGEALD